MVKQITLNLDQLLQEKAEHLDAIKRIDGIIEYYFSENQLCKRTNQITTIGASNKSRMRRALEICENYLKDGNVVNTTAEFMNLIGKHGITLSKAGMSLALKMEGSNIVFDKDNRTWKLNNRG